MPPVDVNYIAVLVSAIAGVVLGFVWWSPLLFGKQWMKAMGWDKKSEKEIKKMQKEAGPAYLGSIVTYLVMAYVLSHVIDFVGATTALEGIRTGFWMWIGFVGTVGLTETLYGQRPMKLFYINYSYHLIALLVMGAILSVWV